MRLKDLVKGISRHLIEWIPLAIGCFSYEYCNAFEWPISCAVAGSVNPGLIEMLGPICPLNWNNQIAARRPRLDFLFSYSLIWPTWCNGTLSFLDPLVYSLLLSLEPRNDLADLTG